VSLPKGEKRAIRVEVLGAAYYTEVGLLATTVNGDPIQAVLPRARSCPDAASTEIGAPARGNSS